MKKSLLILACLSLPLSLMAADGSKRRDERDGVKAVEAAASASAPARTQARDALERQAHERQRHERQAHDPVEVAQHRNDQVAEVRAAKDRGSRMGACRKEAQDQGLGGADMKATIAECLKRAN
jgi:psiF repeat